jgi:Na+-transporting NADH:ubiquinone oxidoreductase subunit C
LEFSNKYIVGFAIGLCLVCSTAVSSIAAGLKERQEANQLFDKQVKVLRVAQLIGPDEKPHSSQVEHAFQDIAVLVFDQATAAPAQVDDVWKFDPRKTEMTFPKEEDAWGQRAKKIGLKSMPKTLIAYQIKTPGKECLVLPIYGNGLWSLLRGFLAIDLSKGKVIGITFYEHGETAGLGAEIENPRWQAQWPGKACFDNQGRPILSVVKQGKVLSPEFEVDGISGATITSVAVGNIVKLWLGSSGYGPFLQKMREVN